MEILKMKKNQVIKLTILNIKLEITIKKEENDEKLTSKNRITASLGGFLSNLTKLQSIDTQKKTNLDNFDNSHQV